MFMHGGFLHIAGNMLFLWVFGNNIEDRLGRVKFLLFYLLAGLIAVYTQALIDPEFDGPDDRRERRDRRRARRLRAALPAGPGADPDLHHLLRHARRDTGADPAGASGSSFSSSRPWARSRSSSGGGEGVAYFAHVGGFVFGLAVAGAMLSVDRTQDATNRAALTRLLSQIGPRPPERPAPARPDLLRVLRGRDALRDRRHRPASSDLRRHRRDRRSTAVSLLIMVMIARGPDRRPPEPAR